MNRELTPEVLTLVGRLNWLAHHLPYPLHATQIRVAKNTILSLMDKGTVIREAQADGIYEDAVDSTKRLIAALEPLVKTPIATYHRNGMLEDWYDTLEDSGIPYDTVERVELLEQGDDYETLRVVLTNGATRILDN